MGIISGLGSFRGRFGDHFRVGDHFGVGIISGAVQLSLSVPGVGHSQFYRGPGGWALAYPGAIPGHLTHVFSKDI